MVSIRSKVVPKATSKTDKRGNLIETRRRVLSPIRDVPVKMTRARVALASKVRATKTKAIKESGGPAEPPDKSSSSRGTKSKPSVKTNASTKVVKSRKKAKVVYRSPSPRFVYREDSQEREYEQYVPKPVPIVPPSIPLPPAENPYACLRDRYLGEGIIGDIIRYSPDQQTLHLWQQVSLGTYNLATRLLYSRGVTIFTQRGYTSFLCGAHTRRGRAAGPECPRLRDKKTLLLLVTALKIVGKIDLINSSIYRFTDCPVELFRNLTRIWFATAGGIKAQPTTDPPKSTKQWLGKLSLTEVRFGESLASSAVPSQGWNRFDEVDVWVVIANIYLSAKRRTQSTPFIGLHYFVYDNTFQDFLLLEPKDRISVCVRRDMTSVDLVAQYAWIANIRCTWIASVIIYGVAQQPPGTALVEGVERWKYSYTKQFKEMMKKPEYRDVQGDERHCQAVVNSFFQELAAIWDVQTKFEFKLISELPPFFPTG